MRNGSGRRARPCVLSSHLLDFRSRFRRSESHCPDLLCISPTLGGLSESRVAESNNIRAFSRNHTVKKITIRDPPRKQYQIVRNAHATRFEHLRRRLRTSS